MTYRSVKSLTDIEAAWIAGIIDGEGTITLTTQRRGQPFKNVQISVASTSYELLRMLKDMTGVGHVSQKKKYEAHHKQSYTWQVATSGQAIDLLRKLLPFLRESVKWKRAKKLVSEWNSVTKRNGKYSDEARSRKLQFEEEFFSI